MAALPDSTPDLLDRLPAEQRALLAALAARGGGPARARDLADEAHINRLSAGQRLQSLVELGLIVQREGDGPRAADHARLYQLTDTGRQLLEHRHTEAGSGPTIHSTVLRDRVQPIAERTRAEIQRTLRRAGEHLESWLASELARVYVAGVADGFAQGVAAEAAARSQERTSA
jgi:predicted ArsR family transcriptional regulator